MNAAIVARGLTKIFAVDRRHTGRLAAVRDLLDRKRELRTAVADVTFSVAPGELVALLGPNGAGKSTTIKMLCGILTPTSGEVFVDGRRPHRERVANARSVGAVFGHKTQLWWDLAARHSFTLLRDIYDLAPAAYAERIREFDAILELTRFWDTPVRHLSLGQRVRCEIAAAMLHDPRVVFLDEPTIGMDVMAKEQVRVFLARQVRDRGRAIVLTTHDMSDVVRLTERVLLMSEGRLTFDGTLRDLRRRFPVARDTVNTGDLEEMMREVYRSEPRSHPAGHVG
jgi:ABC-2 type transport system ATP-binding protein